MNKLPVFTCALFIFILSGCKKEVSLPPLNKDYWGEASANKNNEAWRPYVIGRTARGWPGVYSITMDTYDKNNAPVGGLIIFGLPLDSTGVFRITETHAQSTKNGAISALYVTMDGDDALGDSFALLRSENNYIEISQIKNDTVSGRFNVYCFRNEQITGPIRRYSEKSDTIRFTEGKFYTKIVPAK
jgi:hypothetical protein